MGRATRRAEEAKGNSGGWRMGENGVALGRLAVLLAL